MSSDDESLDNCQYLNDSESDDDDDDEKKPPSSDKAISTLLGERIEFQERGAPHCHMLIQVISTMYPRNLSAASHSATPHP